MIRADLAGRVGRLALQRVCLGDGHEARGAVDLAGGGVDDRPDAQIARGLDHVERAFDVGIDGGVGRMVRVWDCNQRGQVQDCIAAGHGGAHAIRVADVTSEDLELAADVFGAVVQPTPGVEGVVEDEGLDVVARAYEGFGEVGTDETVGAGDEDFIRHDYVR